MNHRFTRFLILVFLFSPFFSYSQGEWNNWVFGWHAGINFNSGLPVPLSNINPTFFASPSSATASDSAGNLLFYAYDDWENESVFNRNNAIMPNGILFSNLLPDDWCTQALVVVPDLIDDSTYYLFSLIAHYGTNPYNGLYYCIINLRLDGGLGDIAPGDKLIHVPGSQNTKYVMTCTRHHNNKDVWIVIRDCGNSYKYLSYLVTSAGIDTIPVESQSTVMANSLSTSQVTFMRISPDGSKFVCMYDTVIEYCSFNTSTGAITPLYRVHCTQIGRAHV